MSTVFTTCQYLLLCDLCVHVSMQGFGALKDFYVVRNGRLSGLDEPLQCGAVYHLEPRLSGGKGGLFPIHLSRGHMSSSVV